MEVKICKKCKIEKVKKDFYKHKAVCKVCLIKDKKQCKYCLKFFVDLEKHEKTKHSNEEEFKYINDIVLYKCLDCENSFPLNSFNHYNDKCKTCYNISRRKEKIKCETCLKMFNFYYFKNHQCLS